MDWTYLLGFAAVAVIFAASFWMILWCHYDDGIVGKIGLAFITLGTLAILIECWDGVDIRFRPSIIFILIGFAIFQVRHLWRTWLYIKQKDCKNRRHTDMGVPSGL